MAEKWNVVMRSPGRDMVSVIKLIRTFRHGLSLLEAYDLIRSPNLLIVAAVDQAKADAIQHEFINVGAEVVILPQ